nr:uncharacterized protein LOC111505635 [Leptinotarsa decemlineata]
MYQEAVEIEPEASTSAYGRNYTRSMAREAMEFESEESISTYGINYPREEHGYRNHMRAETQYRKKYKRVIREIYEDYMEEQDEIINEVSFASRDSSYLSDEIAGPYKIQKVERVMRTTDQNIDNQYRHPIIPEQESNEENFSSDYLFGIRGVSVPSYERTEMMRSNTITEEPGSSGVQSMRTTVEKMQYERVLQTADHNIENLVRHEQYTDETYEPDSSVSIIEISDSD